MSCYEHNKSIRLLVTDNVLKDLDFEDWDALCDGFDDIVEEKYPELSLCTRVPRLSISWSDTQHYIELLLYHEFDVGDGGWAIANMLSDKEAEFFVPIFNRVGLNVKAEDLRKVDYCWYNCCDPPDCFDIEDNDYVELFRRGDR